MMPSASYAGSVITDLTICFLHSTVAPSTSDPKSRKWHRVEKDLYLHASQQRAWLYVELTNKDELAADDCLVTDVRVGERPPPSDFGHQWDERPGRIWLLREAHSGDIGRAVTEIDILFGIDAVDPRPQWKLLPSLQFASQPKVPAARLTVLHGSAGPIPDAQPVLRVREDGTFKMVQISDTHMVTGVGVCKDAIDATGKNLPESEADPLTVEFIGSILDAEQPDLVIFTGDQIHHDAPDSQTALFKVVAPVIKRSIPFAVVFGNHDAEGEYALSREAQMSILSSLPFNVSESGPAHVDGIGNFALDILAPAPSHASLSTLYFLDSHGQIPSWIHNPDYDPIKQSQIKWFTELCQTKRRLREDDNDRGHINLSLVFQHIPLPEFGHRRLDIRSGHRREPSEGPSLNTHFYNALVQERISALGCGHDHVNDFCALLPDGKHPHQPGPWLCYGGASGFGGYCSYGRKRFHRRARTWQVDPSTGSLDTWQRVEYQVGRVDELALVKNGQVVDDLREEYGKGRCTLS